MLQLFEKLINEHGSSTILKERLTILKDEYAEVTRANEELQSQNGALKAERDKERERANKLQAEIEEMKSGTFAKYVCDHCGSPEKRQIQTGLGAYAD